MINKKIIIISALIVIIIVGWILIYYINVKSKISQYNERLKIYQNKEQMSVTQNKIEFLKAKRDSLSDLVNKKIDELFLRNRLIYIGDEIEKIARRYNLKLFEIKPDYGSLSELKEPNTEISVLPITIEYRGLFLQFAKFLDDIDKYQFIRVDEVQIERELEATELKITIKGVVILRKGGQLEKEKTVKT